MCGPSNIKHSNRKRTCICITLQILPSLSEIAGNSRGPTTNNMKYMEDRKRHALGLREIELKKLYVVNGHNNFHNGMWFDRNVDK